jgi:iron complex outermembrane recepter protein
MIAVEAQGATDDPDDLAAVVVTAERSNRTLQSTATSVAVLTSDDVERMSGASTTYDLLERIPNVVATRSSNNAPAIRGIDGGGPAIGANAFFAGTRPRVNFLVDGRTLTFNEAIYLDGGIWDLQQVEVYRGPQSTLQGRNAVGGVIALKTADPTFEWQGKARALAGDDDLHQLSGAVGGPLVEDLLAFRVAADYRTEDSYVHLQPYAELSHPERFKSESFRGKLLLAPSSIPELRSLLTLSYTDAYAPQVLSVKQPFSDYNSAATFTPRFRTRASVAVSDTSWKASDDVTLSAFVTASDFRVNRYVNKGNGIAQIDGKEYTAEPRILLGSSSDSLSGFLAAYVFDAKQDEAIDLFGGGTFNDRTNTHAVFGEVVYRPTDRVDVTLGTRYEDEERDRIGQAGAFVIDYHKSFSAFLPRATLAIRPEEGLTVGVTAGRGYNAGGAGFAFNPPFPSFVYDKETVWNYEGFVRRSLLDGRLYLSGNVFYNDYRGLQLPFDVIQNPAAPATVIRNADRASTYGGEIEARFHALTRVNLWGSAGVVQTKVDRYSDPSIQGNELPRAPAFSASAGVSVTLLANFDVGLDARYTDAYFSDVFNNARGRTDPYVLANAQAAYRFHGAKLTLAVTNLFDADEVVTRTPGTTPAADIATMTEPRRVTVSVEMQF